jgi:hypothetical protein
VNRFGLITRRFTFDAAMVQTVTSPFRCPRGVSVLKIDTLHPHPRGSRFHGKAPLRREQSLGPGWFFTVYQTARLPSQMLHVFERGRAALSWSIECHSYPSLTILDRGSTTSMALAAISISRIERTGEFFRQNLRVLLTGRDQNSYDLCAFFYQKYGNILAKIF